jgi:hypothetical protein
MEILKDIAHILIVFWIITIPISLWLIYILVTELLDFIFSQKKIDEMLKHSDNLDVNILILEYEKQKIIQESLNSPNLIDAMRQVEFMKMQSTRHLWKKSTNPPNIQKIVTAKNLSDIFRIES